MISDDQELRSEIGRLTRLVAEQQQRLVALEREIDDYRRIEAHLLQAISRTNSEFRAILRAARDDRAS